MKISVNHIKSQLNRNVTETVYNVKGYQHIAFGNVRSTDLPNEFFWVFYIVFSFERLSQDRCKIVAISYAAELMVDTINLNAWPGLWNLICPKILGGIVFHVLMLFFTLPCWKWCSLGTICPWNCWLCSWWMVLDLLSMEWNIQHRLVMLSFCSYN